MSVLNKDKTLDGYDNKVLEIQEDLKFIKNYLLKEKDNETGKPLNRKLAADFLNVSTTTLWSWDKSGYLTARRLGKKVFYLKSDLLTFLNQVA